MKIQAIILLIPFSVFLTETISLPKEINNSCKKNTCMKITKEKKCCGKKDNQEKPSRNCNTNPECTVCPICFVFTFQSPFEVQQQYVLYKNVYKSFNAGFVSSYIPPVWKPPNFSLHN